MNPMYTKKDRLVAKRDALKEIKNKTAEQEAELKQINLEIKMEVYFNDQDAKRHEY